MSIFNEVKYSAIEDVIDNLNLLDIYCKANETTGELMMVGGSAILIALSLKNREFRPTRDIDLKILSSSNKEALINSILEADMDLIVGTIEVPPTEDFIEMEKIKIEIDTLENINVYVPTMELLACTKLFSKREKDLDDLLNSPMLEYCNKKTLIDLVSEYKEYILNPDDWNWNFKQLDSILEKKSI